jgi:formyl-CoA transferase
MSVTEPHWTLFCKTIGHPELATDPRYENLEARKEHGDELKAIITAWTSARTKNEAMHELCNAGIPASAVFDTTDIFSDPHLTERGFIHHVSPGENQKEISMLGWPARMSESAVPMELAPGLGDHTAEVLQTEIGMSADAVQALVDDGIIVQRS